MLSPLQIRDNLPPPDRGILCAVSGGLDSMVLLHLLHRWRGTAGGVRAVHFNHCLRPAADRDEAFVRDWCCREGIPFSAGRGDVRAYAGAEGLSVEEAARVLRYRFLRSEAEKTGGCICTAHHMGDNAETVLLNLIRGTGLRGLGGIPPYRNGIYRPFLTVPRSDIRAYADFHGVPHVEDETNADPDAADRNFLRHAVLPLLRELNPRVEEHLLSLSRQAEAADAYLEREAERYTEKLSVEPGRAALGGEALLAAPEALRPRMVRLALDKLGAGRKNIGARHIAAVLGLLTSEEDRSLNLPGGVSVRYAGGVLSFERRPAPLPEVRLIPDTPVSWGEFTLTLREGSANACEGESLVLRGRRAGEAGTVTAAPCPPAARLSLPEGGSRTVKRLCRDRGLSLAERDRLPAFYIDGALAAVWRLGTDRAFLPDTGPFRVIEIRRQTQRGAEYEQRTASGYFEDTLHGGRDSGQGTGTGGGTL